MEFSRTRNFKKKLARSIVDSLHTEHYVNTIIGIGTIVTGIKDLPRSFKESQIALEVGKVFDTEKTIVRENCLTKDIHYVFYDYIFISPSMLQEFKGFGLRNDEILLMFATALKDLAVELGVFVMSSTQLNANGDNNQNIRNESALAGGRSTINKADVGAIIARPTKEEIDVFAENNAFPQIPNMVTDIYKVRSGQYTQIRIWSLVELGTLRKSSQEASLTHFTPSTMSIPLSVSVPS